jgi:hypothetical protein
MPRERFEPSIPVFERAKTVPALDRADTVIGSKISLLPLLSHFAYHPPVTKFVRQR